MSAKPAVPIPAGLNIHREEGDALMAEVVLGRSRKVRLRVVQGSGAHKTHELRCEGDVLCWIRKPRRAVGAATPTEDASLNP
ncbi:MAG: hypothetical protein HY318_12675 [Armatimonadetes bacterium]|nr:hypothetical protein [Armatimonadota bacterium]